MGVIRVLEDAKSEQALDLREKLRTARRTLVQKAAPLAQRKKEIDGEIQALGNSLDDGIVSTPSITEI